MKNDVISMPDISVDDFVPEGTLLMSEDSLPDISVDEMKQFVAAATTTQELADAYANVNTIWAIAEDEIYDYEEETEEYEQQCALVDAWGDLLDTLEQRLLKIADEEGLISEDKAESGIFYRLEALMNKYGYIDSNGWWVRDEDH